MEKNLHQYKTTIVSFVTYLSVSLKLAKVNFTLIKRANFLLQSRHKTSIKQKGEIAIDEAYSFETPLIVIKNLGVSLIISSRSNNRFQKSRRRNSKEVTMKRHRPVVTINRILCHPLPRVN